MMITRLNSRDLPEVIDMTFEQWKESYAGQTDGFIKKASEFIVRKNYYDNEFSYKIVEDGIIRAILFGCHKQETNDALDWVAKEMKNMTESEIEIMDNQVHYLTKFDNLLSTYMTGNDMKIALIISNKRGYGTILLNHFISICTKRKRDDLYLWTDTTCNHQYYPKQGFGEIMSVENSNPNTKEEGYQTIFYKIRISGL